MQLNVGDPGALAGGSTVVVNSGATFMGNALDPLNWLNAGGSYTAVNLVINDGLMNENAGYRASITALNMTGGTLSSGAGSGANGNNYSLNGAWTVTSDAGGNPAIVNATAIGLNGGTLAVNRGASNPAVDMLISSSIVNYGTTALVKTGNGILELTGSNSYTGGTTITSGTLELGNANAVQGGPVVDNVPNGLTFSSSGLTYNVSGLSGSGNIALLAVSGGSLTLNVSGSNATTYAGVISGSGGLTLSGGILTLSGASGFSGNVLVSGGTLSANYRPGVNNTTTSPLGNPQVAGRTITVGNGGTLQFAVGNVLGEGGSSIPLGLVINAGGTVINTAPTAGGASNNTIGPLTLNGGTLTGTGGDGASWGTYDAGSAATETVTVTGTANSAISIIGTGNAYNGFNLAASNTFNVAGPGSLMVSMPLWDQDNGQGPASWTKTGTGHAGPGQRQQHLYRKRPHQRRHCGNDCGRRRGHGRKAPWARSAPPTRSPSAAAPCCSGTPATPWDGGTPTSLLIW